MNKKVHYDRMQKAIKEKNLIFVQYSCTDLHKPPVNITCFYGIDYFTDEEHCFSGLEDGFNAKIHSFLKSHKSHYFVFWNCNEYYSFKPFDLGMTPKKYSKLNEKCIDFDDVLEEHARITGQKYVRPVKPNFDKRYYFALLNNIPIHARWIWGKHEMNIKNKSLLKESSRIKTKVMTRFLELIMLKKKLKLGTNERSINESKKILGVRGFVRIIRFRAVSPIFRMIAGYVIRKLMQIH